jgi:hypothetical protein
MEPLSRRIPGSSGRRGVRVAPQGPFFQVNFRHG